MKKILTTSVKIEPLSTPNYILTVDGDAIAVPQFTEQELRELAAQFTEDLLEKRRKGINPHR